MDSLKHFWKRIPRSVRKPLVFMVGSAIVVAGIAMLVLPGPGWAAIFLGFAVLATEFAVAEKVRDWLVLQLKKLIHYAQRAYKKFRRAH
ncbi:MAG TPA: PGPGW domain-containing protein [Candidatus Saccharimonadales bacterium]